jgi:hypothetical protein
LVVSAREEYQVNVSDAVHTLTAPKDVSFDNSSSNLAILETDDTAREEEMPAAESSHADAEVLPGQGQACPATRIKAPFQLTKMKGFTGGQGRRLIWLWSRRGSSWVVDQEMQLGRPCQRTAVIRNAALIEGSKPAETEQVQATELAATAA